MNTSKSKWWPNCCRPVLLLILFTLGARADEREWFVELHGTNGFYASPGVPQAAVDALNQTQKQKYGIECFAFTPRGDWVLLTENGVTASSRDIIGIEHVNEAATCVAYSSTGAWIGLYRGNGYRGPGTSAWVKVHDLIGSGHEIRSVSFVGKDGFVVLYDETGISYGGVPPELAKVLDHAASTRTSIQCVAFDGSDWICLGRDNWWTSNRNLPASKVIDGNFRRGLRPKWIAFVPYTPFNARKFASIVHQTLDGKLAGGYQCEVIDHGRIVVNLAEGWARAPWERIDPSVKMTINKPIALASVSKTITAAAILKLYEESAGAFSLDEPFWSHLRDICPNVNEGVKRITIRHVLAHQSGFANDCGQDLPDLRKLLSAPLVDPPGTVRAYRNVNYYIARLLIEQIGHVDYSAFVKTHVLVPMGISDMETHSENEQRMCVYGGPGDRESGDDGYIDAAATAGPGSWYGSAADMGKFLEGIRQCKVLGPATTAMMFKENLGWDTGNPWTKGGMGVRSRGRRIHTAIAYFGDGAEAVILVNCQEEPNVQWLLVRAWKDAHDWK